MEERKLAYHLTLTNLESGKKIIDEPIYNILSAFETEGQYADSIIGMFDTAGAAKACIELQKHIDTLCALPGVLDRIKVFKAIENIAEKIGMESITP